LKKKIKLFTAVWSIGLLGGLFLWVLRITGRVEIKGYDRRNLDPKNRGLILIHNHPSLWEPVLLPFIFFPRYLVSYRFIPFSTPDKHNYYDKWWFYFFRTVCVPIERGSPKGEARALKQMQEMLLDGGILIIAPEGGRTFKGDKFKSITGEIIDTINEPALIRSNHSKKIRRFKSGIGHLVFNTKAEILPVWTEGGDRVIRNGLAFKLPFPRLWRKTKILIGEPIVAEDFSKKEIPEILENSMLKIGADC
jgi:1-acyl-sn-glycerol-3-phosphate acyltransferase